MPNPSTIKIIEINGIPTRAKICNGALCQGEWRAVTEYYPRRSKDAAPGSVASWCKKCQAFQHRKRFAKGKWKGVSGRIPVRKVAPYLDELVSKCGNSIMEVARITELSRDSIADMRKEKYETVYANSAKAVFEALLIVRNPGYRPQIAAAPGRLQPSARQKRLREADAVEERGDLYLDTDVAA